MLPDEELTKSRQRAAGKMPQDTAGNASDDAATVARVKLWSDSFLQPNEEASKIEEREVSVFDHRAPLSLRCADGSSETSHIADVLDELWGIPERKAGGEQLDARAAKLIDELEEHLAKLQEENDRLLAVAFGLLT